VGDLIGLGIEAAGLVLCLRHELALDCGLPRDGPASQLSQHSRELAAIAHRSGGVSEALGDGSPRGISRLRFLRFDCGFSSLRGGPNFTA
jgi:hypothetical protein